MLMPSALAIFKSWSGFGLRIPYSYFFIVAEFMPDNWPSASGNLKLLLNVLDKLVVKMDGDELYKEYQKI